MWKKVKITAPYCGEMPETNFLTHNTATCLVQICLCKSSTLIHNSGHVYSGQDTGSIGPAYMVWSCQRVGRVLSFCPVVGIGTPPTPHPQACVPPPSGSRGRGTLAGERGGGRVPISTRGLTLWGSCLCSSGSRGSSLLCFPRSWLWHSLGEAYLGWLTQHGDFEDGLVDLT